MCPAQEIAARSGVARSFTVSPDGRTDIPRKPLSLEYAPAGKLCAAPSEATSGDCDVEEIEAEQPVYFVCGALRSGTTLLRLMLDQHPALCNPGEMDFLFECGDRDARSDFEAYKAQLGLNRIFEATGLTIDETLGHDALIRSFVARQRKQGRVLSINIHRNFNRIPEIFPNARYVHLLRDPRDVALSSVGMGWAGNVYYGVDHWIESERSFETLARAVSAERIMTMRNEALLADPENELRRLCVFMGVDYDPAMLAYPENTTYVAPDPALAEQWRRRQTPRQIGLVEGKVGEMLGRRGYEPSGAAVVRPGRSDRLVLMLENRLGRCRFEVARYGPGLALLNILTRRLPFRKMREAVVRRVNAADRRHLK